MLTRLFLWVTRRSGRARRTLFRGLFEGLARFSGSMSAWTCMNYGYDDAGSTEPLPADAAAERYCIQLYQRVVGPVDLAGCDVIDVSCGLGGGVAFIGRCLGARRVTGLDISGGAIAFCRRVHRRPGLRFIQGDAEDMPLFDDSVDNLINVEASFCYGDFARFLSEVRRVLKPGGYFHFADLRHDDEVDGLFAVLADSGLELLQTADITPQVLRALEHDAARRADGVRRKAPWFARGALADFAGTAGSRIPTLLAEGRLCYFCLLLRKPQDPQTTAASVRRAELVAVLASGGSLAAAAAFTDFPAGK